MANEKIQDFTKKMLREKVFSCGVCKNLLVAPVMTVENIGDVCHDCFQTKNEENSWNSFPNTRVDAILRELEFPCKFQSEGCENEALLYDDLKQHENYCSYRPVNCLMPKEECEWVGKLVDLFKHFEEKHETHVLNKHCKEYFFEIDLQNFDAVTKLFTHRNRMYVLRIEKAKGGNSLLHFLKGESNMIVKYAAGSNVYKTKLPALSFDVACEEQNGQNIQLSTLKEVMQQDEVVRVVIRPEKYVVKNVTSEITKQLECPICKDIMRQPIFQCPAGHSICQSCLRKVCQCPTCRKDFPQENIRNFLVETLTPFVQYECVYSQFGCTSMLLGSEIDEHEDRCTYQTYECPKSNCKFKGNFSSCRNHFKVDHAVDLITGTAYEKTFTLARDYRDASNNDIYFFEYGNIFQLSFYRGTDSCKWNVRILTKYNKHDKYYFTVVVTNSNDPQRFIAKSQWCLDRNAVDDSSISFTKDSLLPYNDQISGQMTFCCEIQKNNVCSNLKKRV
ncbi:hypothetical protein Zmor_016247 [Zophobas morio]|uniref:RING-type E3 ubiquitin transferase n=1 Tax=Zophobas morio TaxID=2755281 RepID=A0AA38MIB4_9CUCU|nr:hypothetical protein Zmor_016247 [Zophobas morio]